MAVTPFEPFHQPGRTFLATTCWDQPETDWSLAYLAMNERSFAVYGDDPRAEEAAKIATKFTAEEAQRVDAYLATTLRDTERMEAIAAAPEVMPDDAQWLITELRQAWKRLDRLHDAVDNSGSMMTTTYVSSSVDYIRHFREPWAQSPTNPRTAART